MFFKSLRTRLLFLNILIATITAAAVSLAGAGVLQQVTRDRLQNELQTQSVALAALYSKQADESILGSADSGKNTQPILTAQDLQQLTNAKVFYLGIPLYTQTDRALKTPEGIHLDPEKIVGRTQKIQWHESGTEYLGYASPVTLNKQRIGILIVAQPSSALNAVWHDLGQLFILSLFMAWMIGLLLALITGRQMTQPLKALSDAADQVAGGDYQVDVPIPAHQDEISRLSESFQNMASQLQRVDERDRRFFMSITHELRTPLTIIRGHGQMMQELDPDPEEQQRSLAIIQGECDRLQRIIDDVIDLARLRGGRFSIQGDDLNIQDLISHVVDGYHDEKITVTGTSPRLPVFTDGARVEQILHNLIGNGLRYATSEIAVTAYEKDQKIIIEVVNDGPPVEAECQEALFEAFYGDKREGGMGLGLTISSALARNLGGHLGYFETTGAGFRLTLPKNLHQNKN